jgi:hypothetical protein
MFYPFNFHSLLPIVESVQTLLTTVVGVHVSVPGATGVHSSPNIYPNAVSVPTPFIEALANLVIELAAVNVAIPSILALPSSIRPPNAVTVAVPAILASLRRMRKPSAVSVATALIEASA